MQKKYELLGVVYAKYARHTIKKYVLLTYLLNVTKLFRKFVLKSEKKR